MDAEMTPTEEPMNGIPMNRMILTEAPETEPTTNETTHEQTPPAPAGGRHRAGTIRRIIVILLLIAPAIAPAIASRPL
jgi:hypothetical protein